MTRLCALLLLLLVTTPAVANATVPPTVLALIVTNNHSAQLGRPDLRYADDDGAKYYELFRMLAPESQIALLTDFDADTARLFPALTTRTKTPSRANLERSAAMLARKVDDLRAEGQATDFYFIYAGHGDIDGGRGFVELTDSAVNSDDLEALVLRRVRATRTHVILDSCNSFFVLNPRKPGGHRFPTAKEAAAELAARLPTVGVFLSTSAEAQVYEWSELQSGIFSHAVRSGLMGAADANGDGEVSYGELEAFVELAAKDVRNPLYRPSVFARGPGGSNELALVDLAGLRAATLTLPAGPEQRLTVRDHDDLPWVDLHTEADASVQVRLPSRVSEQATIEVHALDATGLVIQRRTGQLAPQGATLLAQLQPRVEANEPRGPGELFKGLFLQPFGPRALAAYLARDQSESSPPLRIAQEDIARMRLLLRHTAEIDRARRLGQVASGYAIGGLALGLGSGLLSTGLEFGTPRLMSSVGLGLVVGGAAEVVLSTVFALRHSKGERIYRDFEGQMANRAADQSQIVARTERDLFRLGHSEHRERRLNLILSWVLAGTGSIALGLSAIAFPQDETLPNVLRIASTVATFWGITTGIQSSFETPLERMVRLWTEDPCLQKIPRIGVAATSGGMSLGLSRSF